MFVGRIPYVLRCFNLTQQVHVCTDKSKIFTQQVSACRVKTETSEGMLEHKHLLHEGKQQTNQTTYSRRHPYDYFTVFQDCLPV